MTPHSRTRSETSVSIIMPYHRCNSHLEEAFRAITTLSPPPLEVILVHDAPTTPFHPQDFGSSSFTLIHHYLATRSGPAAARNAGAMRAQSEILLFTDSDVILPPDTIAQIRHHLEGSGKAVIAVFAANPRLNLISRYKNSFMRFNYLQFPPHYPIPAFLASAAACFAKDFQAIGGFDENYKEPSVEDAEIGRKMSRFGILVFRIPQWEVYHMHQYTMRELLTVGFKRAQALVELAVKMPGTGFVRGRTSRAGFKYSLPLSLAVCGLLLAAIFPLSIPKETLMLLTAIFTFGIYALNLPFLKSITKENNIPTLLFALLFLPLDLLSHACGVIWGLIETRILK